MAPKRDAAPRLPRNFHRTFIPERQYLNALLQYAAGGHEGTPQAISAATGIPTGESTGKVPAILDYCRGMGLVVVQNGREKGSKRPELTAFGRTVLLEDAFLREELTQWLAHLNLCCAEGGSDVWYQVFCLGRSALGSSFSRKALEDHLSVVYGTRDAKIIGPLVRTYEDDAALGKCGALCERDGTITRRPAPVADEFARGYGAWLLALLERHFPGTRQVTVTELESCAGWRSIPGWGLPEGQRVLNLVSRKGLFDVDRQMSPWIVRPTTSAVRAWASIYSDLV